MIRDLPPERRRVLDRALERGRLSDDLTVARRRLSRVYNEYFAGVQTSEEMQVAEADLYLLLKKEFAKPVGARSVA